jgi:spermidine/putrescine transport system substrate-binding protein
MKLSILRLTRLFVPLAVIGGAVLLSSCSRFGKPVLHVYNWSDYMDPDAIALFEERFNCRVVIDTFDSNEAMYAKLKAGSTGYDVIFPSGYQAVMMWEEGMLLPLNLENLPNLRHIDRTFVERFGIDKEYKYSVPYMSGTTGIAWRASAFDDEVEASWNMFANEAMRGRMTLLDDMRETLGAALKSLGFSLNSRNPAEIEAAGQLVRQWRANIAKFESEGYKPGIASREFLVVHGYSGDILQVMAEEDDVVFGVPREGFTVWLDDMAIPATADNVPLAEAFINFMHEPEIAALNMNFNYYASPNKAAYALIDEELRNDPTVFISDDLLQNAEVILPLGEDIALYIRVWDAIKSTR